MSNINKIKNYWNKRAKNKSYRCTNDLNLQEKELEILLDIIKPNKSILDLGCGDGMLLKKLAKIKKINGLGLDYSKELINEANKKDQTNHPSKKQPHCESTIRERSQEIGEL